MAKKRRGGHGGSHEHFPEPDLLPLMNILFMLIIALITMSSLLPLGFLSSHAQKLATGGAAAIAPKEEKVPLNLIVFIMDNGFNISVRGSVKMGEGMDPNNPKKKRALIPVKIDASGNKIYDYEALLTKLEGIKALDIEEDKMTITADEEIRFEIVVDTMDAARFSKDKKPLYPLVSFAAGMVGA